MSTAYLDLTAPPAWFYHQELQAGLQTAPWLQPDRGHKDRPPKHEGDDTIQFTALEAASTAHHRSVLLAYFGATFKLGRKEKDISITFVFVKANESRGPVRIERSALISGDGGSLLASPPGVEPTTATMTLPHPFVGSASYSESVGTEPIWSGTLGVNLPGADRLPLTGKEFSAALCRDSSAQRLSRCLHEVEAKSKSRSRLLASRPQGSGSQSQAFWDVKLSWSR